MGHYYISNTHKDVSTRITQQTHPVICAELDFDHLILVRCIINCVVNDHILTIHINLCFKNLLDNVFHFYIVGVKRKAGAPIDKTNELWLRLWLW